MTITRVRVDLSGTVRGPSVSTFYFAGASVDTPGLGPAAVKAFWEALKPMMISGTAIEYDGQVDFLDEATGALTGQASAAPWVVTGIASSTDQAPPANQGVLILNTGQVVEGKRLQGRLFIPGPRAANSSTPNETIRSAYQAAANTLVTNSAGFGGWVVWSRTYGVVRPVTSPIAWTQWGVLRSRRD